MSRYQKGKTNLDFTEARDSEWQWNQLDHMQVCTSLQTDNHARTHHSVFYEPDALPAAQTNSVNALNALSLTIREKYNDPIILEGPNCITIKKDKQLLHLFNGLFSGTTWVS